MILYFLLLFSFILPLQANDAYAHYTAGERTTEVEARKNHFNDALTAYLKMEARDTSGELFYNIANTYFQLGEYGYAILYYYKALKEHPRDEKIHHNLAIAYQRAGLQGEEPYGFIRYMLSKDEMIWAVLILLGSALALFSIDLWNPFPFCRKLAYVTLAIVFILIATISWNEYFARKDAIVVRATSLRRDAGQEYAPIQAEPALPGMRAEVLGIEKEGNWMKVRLQSGQVGYIAKEDIRLI